MAKSVDLTGKKFNRLTVISFSHKKHNYFWNCICDCGNKITANGSMVKQGRTKSCGCLSIERSTKHNKWGTPAYKTWAVMIQRCTNSNNPHYEHYMGRGITVCDKWMNFEGFYEDMGDPAKGLTLDRINNDGNYCKENCRWATKKEQSNNRRTNRLITYNGKTQSIAQWSEELGFKKGVLSNRLNECGWSVENAMKVINGGAAKNGKYKNSNREM